MTASIILVTGGARSGKSRYALSRAQELPAPRLFIATAPTDSAVRSPGMRGRMEAVPRAPGMAQERPTTGDSEMDERIAKHRLERGEGWETIEEETGIASAIARTRDHGVILVDCLTLWISNLMMLSSNEERSTDEAEVIALCGEVITASRSSMCPVIFVTNEVGMGTVPDHALARRFRDLAGRCNQVIASAADEVYCLVSGIPLKLR